MLAVPLPPGVQRVSQHALSQVCTGSGAVTPTKAIVYCLFRLLFLYFCNLFKQYCLFLFIILFIYLFEAPCPRSCCNTLIMKEISSLLFIVYYWFYSFIAYSESVEQLPDLETGPLGGAGECRPSDHHLSLQFMSAVMETKHATPS